MGKKGKHNEKFKMRKKLWKRKRKYPKTCDS